MHKLSSELECDLKRLSCSGLVRYFLVAVGAEKIIPTLKTFARDDFFFFFQFAVVFFRVHFDVCAMYV